MKKKYKIKITKLLLKQLTPFWVDFEKINEEFNNKIRKIEKEIEKLTGIKNIEFFYCDNECVGIGNLEKTMPLIHREELEGE